jgi:lipopolysaccharide transport system permease protein
MSSKGMNPPAREIIIKPHKGWTTLNLRELFESRFLLWNLIRRNVKKPYIDLSFGVFWTLLRPLLFVFVFFVIKHKSNADMKEGLPYVLFVYSGVILWWYFANATTSAIKSIYKDKNLITKVYYPRLITPIVPVVAGTTDLFIQMAMMPVGVLVYWRFPDWHILLLPLVLLHVMVLALGLGLIIASLSMESRDFISMMDYILYIAMFLSPVIYSPSILPEKFHHLYYLINPIAAPLEVFRGSLFRGLQIPWLGWGVSFLVSLCFLVIGAYVFKRVEAYLADYVL